jgi:hypothetical protein
MNDKHAHASPAHAHGAPGFNADSDAPDAWHSHSAGGPRPQEAHSENIDIKSVVFFGVAGFLIVVVSVALTAVYFNWYKNQLFTARIENFDKQPVANDASQAKGLHVEALARRSQILETQFKSRQFDTANPETKTVRIPMEDAFKKVSEKYSSPAK